MDNNSSSSTWDLEMSNMGINHFPLELFQPTDPPFFLGSSPSPASTLIPPPPPPSGFIPCVPPIVADLGEEEEDEEEEEEAAAAAAAGAGGCGARGEVVVEEEEETLGAMKEMMYRIAAMQPVDIDPASIKKPRRRNVRISDDPQSVAARHRRERISERIRILQRLVPGGTKMDTASMLDEAIRYVKFLKRQVQELQHSSPPPPPPPPPIPLSAAIGWASAPPRPPPPRLDAPSAAAAAAASSSSSSSAMGAPPGLGFGF